MSGSARPTVQVDNDRVRVTEWRFASGAATGWHRHEHDYVIVPMTTGRLRITNREGREPARTSLPARPTSARRASSTTS